MPEQREWKNRIIGEGVVDPATLLAHPQNWRVHGHLQAEAMAGVLNEVGWVQRVIVNQRTGQLVDGHLRVKLALQRQESSIPVLYVDLSEEEERLVLVTLDPIAALAEADKGMLRALLEEVSSGDAGIQQMLSQLAQEEGITPPAFAPVSEDEQGRLDQKKMVTCPHCGGEFVP